MKMKMKMKTVLIAVLAVFALCSPVQAETIKGDMPLCLTKDYLDQFFVDKQSAMYLMSKGVCVRPRPNLRVSVLERNWSSQVKVRVYFDDGTALVAWTTSSNLR